MDIVKDISKVKDVQSSVITIGTFDGLHLGHQHLIQKNVELSKKMNSKSVIITFSPNPHTVINNISSSSYHIISKTKKYSILNTLGVDTLLDINFNHLVADMTAEQFFKEYILPFCPCALVVGYDHRFGKDRKGDYKFLLNKCEQYNYNLISIEAFTVNEDIVSSSIIRENLKVGSIKKVNSMLGRKYSIKGLYTISVIPNVCIVFFSV